MSIQVAAAERNGLAIYAVWGGDDAVLVLRCVGCGRSMSWGGTMDQAAEGFFRDVDGFADTHKACAGPPEKAAAPNEPIIYCDRNKGGVN